MKSATIMISLASFILALAAAPTSAHGLAPLDTTPLHAKSSVADTAASDYLTTAAEKLDESRRADSDSLGAREATSVLFAPTLLGERLASEDTVVHKRRRAVVMSDAAILRLRIHRYASYTVIPLFALQAIAGNQLLQADNGGVERPGWAKSAHSFGAAAIGTVFAVNTITGVWSLYDQRANTDGRTRRWVHSILMLASDAGFTWTGTQLADDAKRSSSSRDDHRNVAYASIGTALVGYGIMYFGNR